DCGFGISGRKDFVLVLPDFGEKKPFPMHKSAAAIPVRKKPSARNKHSRVRSDLSEIRFPKSEVLLGAHMSIGGGVHRAIERARSINCTAMQIFVKNNMQWFARPLQREEISAFLDHAQRAELRS